jgi:hypothetical protein
LVIEPLDEPGGVIDVTEGEQREPEFFDGGEGPDPEQVFLERSDEALCAAISLRRTDESWRALNAQEAHLGLEGVGHVLRAMIVTNGQAAGDILADGAEVPSYALAQRFEGFKTGPTSGGMNADALSVVVIDRNEDRRLALPSRSVPHIMSIASGMMVPSWLRGPRG